MSSSSIIRKDGVAVIICNAQGHVLVGQRKGSHGAGSWGLPGGHVDPGESREDTAAREVLEETGLTVQAEGQVERTEDDFVEQNKYYNTFFLRASLVPGTTDQPEIREPNKCAAWEWKSWSELQAMRKTSKPDEVLFRPLHKLLTLHPDLETLRPGK